MKTLWITGLIFIVLSNLQAQNAPFAVEVGAYARPVELSHFSNLQNVYEAVDANWIYRYYIDAPSREDAKILQKEALQKGYQYAKVVDFEELKSQCDVFCQYTLPERTGVALKTPLQFHKDPDFDLDLTDTIDAAHIQSIFFGYDKDGLRKASRRQLLKLAIVLYQNPSFTTELRAHTDSRGSNSYNEKLSKKRANMAKEYLMERGISADRVQSRAYGEDAPIAKNRLADGADSETGRQFNRRVELVVFDGDGRILSIVDKIYVPEDLREED